jgi:hypothetical protein
MDITILWLLLILGLILFLSSLRKAPIYHLLFVFLITAYFTTFISVFIVENGMLEYPVRFLSQYFVTNVLYENLLLPVICMYFYRTTYNSSYTSWIIQCIVYNAFFTTIEVLFERHTDLIHYHTWTWVHTFISTFLFMLTIRMLIQFINKKTT